MAVRPLKDVAIRTWRDDQRQKQRDLLTEMYARVDADIADALGEQEDSGHGQGQPQLR